MLMIGANLLSDGHKVDFIASPHFEDKVKAFGLRLLPLGTKEQYNEALLDPEVWQLRKAFAVVWKYTIAATRQTYELIANEYTAGDTLLIGTSLAIGARLAQEKLKIPMASVHLSPALMLSSLDTPMSPTSPLPEWMPSKIRAAWVQLFERFIIDPIACPPLNQVRAELGLAPVKHIITRFIHSPQLVLCAFPEWFAGVQADWPANSVNCNFPIYKDRSEHKENPVLKKFLQEGSPPAVITAGTAMAFARPFIAEGLHAVNNCGMRAIVVCAFDEQVPELPANAMHVRYADFNELFAQASLLIHHGGIGTTATSIAQGCPQIVLPFAHDQFDNAKRLEKLGIGRMISPDSKTKQWTDSINHLRTIEVKKRCEFYQNKLQNEPTGHDMVTELLKKHQLLSAKSS